MPRPDTQSSPGTQSGQSDPSAATTRQALLGSGTPNGTATQSAGSTSGSQMVLWMAVSVAPPSPANRTPGAASRNARTRSTLTQSPPAEIARSVDNRPRPTSISI